VGEVECGLVVPEPSRRDAKGVQHQKGPSGAESPLTIVLENTGGNYSVKWKLVTPSNFGVKNGFQLVTIVPKEKVPAGGTLLEAQSSQSVDLTINSLDHKKWSKGNSSVIGSGGDWSGQVTFDWWLVDGAGNRISGVMSTDMTVDVVVTSRVPALVLPSRLDLDETDATSFLSIYAVGTTQIVWSIYVWNETCQKDPLWPQQNVLEPTNVINYGYIGNAAAGGAEASWATEGLSWLKLETPGLNATKYPGNGLADPVPMQVNITDVLRKVEADQRENYVDSALTNAPVVDGCVTVKVEETNELGEEANLFQVWVPVQLTVNLKCPKGHANSENGKTPCEPCAVDMYADQEGSERCKSCSDLPYVKLNIYIIFSVAKYLH
jgi:hypothetical protein